MPAMICSPSGSKNTTCRAKRSNGIWICGNSDQCRIEQRHQVELDIAVRALQHLGVPTQHRDELCVREAVRPDSQLLELGAVQDLVDAVLHIALGAGG